MGRWSEVKVKKDLHVVGPKFGTSPPIRKLQPSQDPGSYFIFRHSLHTDWSPLRGVYSVFGARYSSHTFLSLSNRTFRFTHRVPVILSTKFCEASVSISSPYTERDTLRSLVSIVVTHPFSNLFTYSRLIFLNRILRSRGTWDGSRDRLRSVNE